MSHATALAAGLLARHRVSDEQFFEATALLATRFDRSSSLGDLRSDGEAPAVLFAWFAHARSRAPDLRVWDLSCAVNQFFDPGFGLYLPHEWPWDTRDRVLAMSAGLRALPEWRPAFERALAAPDERSVRALACCGAELCGADPYPIVWAFLTEHVEDGLAWSHIGPMVDEGRLSAFLTLARKALLRKELCMPSPQRKEALWHVWRQVLETLRRFPGEGIDLVEAALRSRDTGLRMQAIDLLSVAWHAVELPLDTRNLIAECEANETEDEVRDRFGWLLQRA